MQDLKLTDYGSVIAGTDEVKVDTFIEQIKNGDGYFHKNYYDYTFDNFYFNKERGRFDVSFYQDGSKYNCYLVISDLQKELLDQGTPSDELLKLITYSEKVQYKKRQEQITKKFYETGKLPTDPEELVIYNDILEQELKDTNANILKNRIISSVIPTVFASSFLITAALVKAKTGADIGNTLFFSGLISFSATFITFMGFLGVEVFPFPISKIKEEMDRRDIITEKIKRLNGSEEKRIAIEVKKSFTPEGIENKEIKDVSKNSNAFLLELDEVKKKIAMLPKDEREPYIRELIGIVSEYYAKVTAILDRDNNKIVLGDAANLWSLNMSMLPKLLDLSGRLDQRLSTLKEKKELNDTLKQFKKSVEDLDTGKGYTDGWTDGYTDDLASGGVAYATMENGSVTSRKMA